MSIAKCKSGNAQGVVQSIYMKSSTEITINTTLPSVGHTHGAFTEHLSTPVYLGVGDECSYDLSIPANDVLRGREDAIHWI